MTTNLSFRIGAQDDSSAVFSKIASAAKREMGQVEGALDEGASAGKRMADALNQVADDLDRELADTARAADKLGQALGDDLRAKIGDNGLEKFVSDLRTAGLSVNDIETEADELAAALKRMDDVSGRVTGNVGRSFRDLDMDVDKVRDTTDKTRSVMANFAGNAAQDIPGIAGSFGALNVAAGQFAEYAAEGDIAMRNMMMSLGPIALATVAIGTISKHFADIAKVKAFDADQVKDWTDRMKDGADAVEAIAESAAELGKLELSIDLGLDRFKDQIIDLTPYLDGLGVTVQQFAEMTQFSEAQLNEWASAQVNAGANANAVGLVLAGVTAAQENAGRAVETAAIHERVYGGTLRDTATELENLRERHDEAADAVRGLTSATLESFDAQLRAEESLARTTEAVAEYRDTVDDADTPINEVAEAERNAAGAALEQAVAMREAAGAAEGTAEGNRIMIDSLQSVISTLGPTDPLRVRLQGYVDELNNVPTTRETTIVAHTADAVRAVQELQRQIHGVTANSHEVNFHARTGTRSHGGGEFHAPPGQTEGLVLLRDGQRVVSPEGGASAPHVEGGGTTVVQINLDGRQIAEAVVPHWDAATRQRRRQG